MFCIIWIVVYIMLLSVSAASHSIVISVVFCSVTVIERWIYAQDQRARFFAEWCIWEISGSWNQTGDYTLGAFEYLSNSICLIVTCFTVLSFYWRLYTITVIWFLMSWFVIVCTILQWLFSLLLCRSLSGGCLYSFWTHFLDTCGCLYFIKFVFSV